MCFSFFYSTTMVSGHHSISWIPCSTSHKLSLEVLQGNSPLATRYLNSCLKEGARTDNTEKGEGRSEGGGKWEVALL